MTYNAAEKCLFANFFLAAPILLFVSQDTAFLFCCVVETAQLVQDKSDNIN